MKGLSQQRVLEFRHDLEEVIAILYDYAIGFLGGIVDAGCRFSFFHLEQLLVSTVGLGLLMCWIEEKSAGIREVCPYDGKNSEKF